ncbi:MAG: sugar transferase [Candidatus Saccharibacteria bacterium]|nr:sugar transferase [Candidatus Saccharibacteria bacterium]
MPATIKAKSIEREALTVQSGYGFLRTEAYHHPHAVRFVLYGATKRVVDEILAILLLVLLAPFFLIIAILVKIDSPGPVLFKQERVGKNGKIFKILKFRSMIVSNDIKDGSCKDKYTRVGRVIRRTSIDELPQLFNVLMGQMSFVGPRPWVVEYWTNMNAEERERARVLPGITGLAQVKGRNGISIFQKIEYDLTYVKNFSLLQDVKILFLTVKTVFAGDGVDAGKEGVMDDIRDLRRG